MARTHARVLLAIWADRDWLALPIDAQWLYLQLLGQDDLNHAGVLSLAVRRWADAASDGNTDRITAALTVLADTRFVVVDHDSEQVLIRSFIRNDGVDRSPNTLKAACASILLLRSRPLRAALLAELLRLDRDRIVKMRPSRAEHSWPIDVLDATITALAGDAGPPGTRSTQGMSISPSDGYGTDGYTTDPNPRTRAGAGAGEGVGEVPVSRSEELLLGETPRPPRRRPTRAEADGQMPLTASVPAGPDIAALTPIPDRCPRCTRLGLADDDPGPDCAACGRLRKQREQRAAALGHTHELTEDARRRAFRAAVDACPDCDDNGRTPDTRPCPCSTHLRHLGPPGLHAVAG